MGNIHCIIGSIGQLQIGERRQLCIDLLIGFSQLFELRGHLIACEDDCRIAATLHRTRKPFKPLNKMVVFSQFRVLSVGDTRNRRDVLLWQIFKQTSSPFIH